MVNEFADYIEGLCSSNKLVNHSDKNEAFYRFDIDDLNKKLRNINAFPAVVLEGSNISYRSNRADRLWKPRDSALIFCMRVDDMDRADLKQNVYDQLEELGDQFFTKILEDSKSRDIKALISFDMNSVNGSRLEDDSNRILMIRFEFSSTGRVNTVVNPEDWNK